MTSHAVHDSNACEIAQKVSAFYERHPYPPPLDDLERYRQSSNEMQRRVDACLFWPDQAYRDDRSILVAGCGTSQAARYAIRWPNARVVGIDVSSNSIERTAALKRKHGLDNLELHQLPVEGVTALAGEFEYIVCTGVLHHLPDPDRGLHALREVLTPDGAMHLMVYAPYGRSGVYLLQDYCRRLGIGTTTAEIRDLAASLRLLPPDHPLVPLLRNSPDFQDEAGLADALLHPHDRAYTVPQIFDFLAAAGLEFGRWLRQAAYLPQCGALASSPHHSALMRLPVDEQYAAAEVFRGSMLRHNVIAFRKDHPSRPTITFDADDLLDHVPIRLPDTVVVEERLPTGAAAVVLNRKQTYTDLYLPIDAQQKALFDAIDGARSIGEIALGKAEHACARLLFEKLWRYDLVVFGPTAKS